MSLNLRLPCSHGEYQGHGGHRFAAQYGTRWCQGYRTLTDAEAIELVLVSRRDAVLDALDPWEVFAADDGERGVRALTALELWTRLVAAVAADEEAEDG